MLEKYKELLGEIFIQGVSLSQKLILLLLF
jgi:hypothetical protein